MSRDLPRHLLALSLIAATTGLHATEPAQPAHHPLRPISECLRPDRINEWYLVDSRTAIARTGPDRYQIKLEHDCPRLGIGVPGLLFHASEANRLVGESRICGEVGETVSARNQPPCAIAEVSKIDKATFEALEKQALRSGNGAEPKNPPPPRR
ncbi:DUF6491 family protein [Aerosticca soli]|mgnify:CR=1 FL=1|jgi:hypothetical protein|uniref:Uncharacterized protein n=1 Tax=Aerosticca soli TaxID=2010829 RepID=A0A2Z6E4U1_9GAMM|nr:DUF6491 family protein [Aerosticca soli]MDI3261615.1 DUF6491 family protein [Fulvimonas sp.]BBD79922.1 hypothetical protein ALSL_1264 [Aerosticca soli]